MPADPRNNAGHIAAAALLRDGCRGLDGGDRQLPPRRLCELLLCDILECRPIDLYAEPETRVSAAQQWSFEAGMKRLAAGEPLQYVTGRAVFMERVFRCDARALIPRPETETLARALLECRCLWESVPRPAVLEVGVGGGCIIVTLALERRDAICLGVDISAAALDLARANARDHGVAGRVALFRGDVLDAVGGESLDAIVTNPPYIASGDRALLPAYIRDFEPRLALDGGPSGLEAIGRWTRAARARLRPGGFLFVETGDGQADAALAIMRAAGFVRTGLRHDASGRARVVWGQCPPAARMQGV